MLDQVTSQVRQDPAQQVQADGHSETTPKVQASNSQLQVRQDPAQLVRADGHSSATSQVHATPPQLQVREEEVRLTGAAPPVHSTAEHHVRPPDTARSVQQASAAARVERAEEVRTPGATDPAHQAAEQVHADAQSQGTAPLAQLDSVREPEMQAPEEKISLLERFDPQFPPPTVPTTEHVDGWGSIDQLPVMECVMSSFPAMDEVPDQFREQWARAMEKALSRIHEAQTNGDELDRAIKWWFFLPQALLRKAGRGGRAGMGLIKKRFDAVVEEDYDKLRAALAERHRSSTKEGDKKTAKGRR